MKTRTRSKRRVSSRKGVERGAGGTWKDLLGCVRYKGSSCTVRQMDEAVVQEIRRRKR